MRVTCAFRHRGRTAALLPMASLLFSSAAAFGANTAIHGTAGSPAVLEGEVEILVEDHVDGHARTRYFLETARGRVELESAGKPLALASGSRVRVRGTAQGDGLVLDSAQAASVETLYTPTSTTLGEQKTAVILFNFEDDTSQPITPAAADTLVLTTTSKHYEESSFGQTWFTGRTFGYHTLPLSKAACDPVQWYTEADKAVAAAGGDLAGYTRRIYFFPRVDTCGWDGLATQGLGGLTKVYINGPAAATLRVVGHEIGHNYGLSHAHALDCDLGALGNTCRESSYGDVADTMGGYRAGHFSAFAKELLGWLNDGISPPILTASTSGRFVIEPYSASSVGPKAVKVPAGVDSLGRKRWYYLEYRQPIGFDAVLADAGNLTEGVLVRMASEGDPDSMFLLDMHAGLSNTTSTDLLDGALAVGQTFMDPTTDVSFTLVSVTAGAATIDVSVGDTPPAPVCTRAMPTLALGGSTAAVAAGSTVHYTVDVTNQDSSACAATTFDLARSVPAGWTGMLAASTITLSPGASGTTTLSVTSPASATPGGYGIGVGTGSSAGGTHAANASATYTIVGSSGVLTGTVGTDKATYARAETVSMSALVKNGGVPVSGASVQFRVGLPNGSVVSRSATSGGDGYARSSYKVGKGKNAVGSYVLRADVTSGSATTTASTGFSVR